MGVVAYLDPGSGSIIVATAAAGLAGAGVAAKNFWNRSTHRLRKAGPEGSVDEVGDSEETEDTQTGSD